jgi:uncharacterized zinc-type alcohol dehydrogenase-like protein
MRVEEKFAFKIPDVLPTTFVCPLMCGGCTVFEPIMDYVKPGSTVGVYSIGGLGTCAIKLAKLVGASVTAFSRTADKETPARQAGASKFIITGDKAAVASTFRTLDVMIDTCPINHDLAPLMDLLKFDGTYVRCGIPPAGDATFSYNWVPMIFAERKIAGTIITGTQRSNLLLQLVADNWETTGTMQDAEGWQVSVVPFSDVNKAMKDLKAGTLSGYRQVLQW